MNVLIFHMIYILSIFSFLGIRVAYHRKARKARRQVNHKESKFNIAVRTIFGLGYVAALVVYALVPHIFEWADFILPSWVRGVGAVITVASVLLIWWVQWALDVQFDTTLHIQADHQMITHGPYQWVRHPMYSALFSLGWGWLLLTANWLIGAPLMIGIVLVVLVRIKKEENLLIDLFGDDYQNYMQKTGRFLPSISIAHH